MPTCPGPHPSLESLVENAEIISKTKIGALLYMPLTEEGAGAYPVSRTDQGVSWDRRGQAFLATGGTRGTDCWKRF
jgi:hypothetical protein